MKKRRMEVPGWKKNRGVGNPGGVFFRNGWESGAWGGEVRGVLEDEVREALQEESRAGNDEAREALQEESRAGNAVGTGESKIK